MNDPTLKLLGSTEFNPEKCNVPVFLLDLKLKFLIWFIFRRRKRIIAKLRR